MESYEVYTWFIPLPSVIDLEQGQVFTSYLPRDVPDYTSHEHPIFSLAGANSFKFWQLPVSVEGLTGSEDSAFEACTLAFPDICKESVEQGGEVPADLTGTRSVLEVSVSRYKKLEDYDEPNISEYLESAIRDFRRFLAFLNISLGRAYQPIVLQDLPLLIPMVISSVDRDGFHPGDSVAAYFFPSNMWKFRESQAPSAPQRQRISAATSRMHGFLDSYVVARYEAISALEHRGDARSSVLAIATACECMMDDVLRHLSWESGEMPKEAVKYFVEGNRIKSVTQRLQKDFNGLIPGNWNINGQPVLKRYLREVARVRHKTIHAGYDPSIEEARAAIEVCEALMNHIGGRVLKQLSRYPRTALAIYGIDDLKDRGLFTKSVREISQADPNEANIRFIRWRNAIERLAEGRVYDEKANPAAEKAQIVAIVGPGTCTWFAHDTTSHKAALIESLDEMINESTKDSLKRMMDSTVGKVSVAIDYRGRRKVSGSWQEEYDVIPGSEITVPALTDGFDERVARASLVAKINEARAASPGE